MPGVAPYARTPLLILGTILVGSGLVLVLQRTYTEGPLRLWPLLLIVVGAGRAVAGPSDARDEGLWLLGTGLWLLADTLTPVLLRTAAPLAIALAGLAALRQASSRRVLIGGRHGH